MRSAAAVEFGLAGEFNLTDEAVAVEISYSDLPLFFFFLRLWIPCDCDYVLCCVWWGFVEDFEFFFFYLEFIRRSMIVVVVCGSGGCWFLDGGNCCWAMCLYREGLVSSENFHWTQAAAVGIILSFK